MSSVRFDGIEKRFEAFTALHSLSLEIPDRSFLALLGPSGCGKTTALRILAGLELPTAGRVLIGDRDVTRLQPRDRDVAMVFQSYALYPHMTIAENIGYPLKIRNVDPATRAKKIAEVSAALEIKRLCHRLGATTIYVTHDQAEALTMADLVAVMKQGELQQLAPPHEIYDRPANRFVALFVGNPPMNVLKAAVGPQGVMLGGVTLALDAARKGDCLAAGVAEIGIRPEDIAVVAPGTPGALPGEVYVVEPMGNETLVDVRIDGQRMTVRAERGFRAAIGSAVGVTFDTADACFFDETGSTRVHRAHNMGGQQ